jgi:uncharacterized protein YbjT (DUF2867 family)
MEGTMTYVVTGATGNIGRIVAETLLEKGKKVRVVSRSAERLRPLTEKGAEPAVGDLLEPEFVVEAFEGATAVFALIPPNHQVDNFRAYQGGIGRNITEAVKSTGMRYVVNLSSLGAHLDTGTGPVLGLHDQEERLNKLKGVNVVHLRPTYFTENRLGNIALIKGQGINGGPLKTDVRFPLIATRDIAHVAAEYLLKLDFEGKVVRELLGPKDLTMKEITRIIGKAIGYPSLQYIQFSYEEAENAIVQMGISRDMARALIELNRSINEGFAMTDTPRTEENTTETTFEKFAEFFAQAYNN